MSVTSSSSMKLSFFVLFSEAFLECRLMFNFDEGDMSLFGILVGRRVTPGTFSMISRERLRESLEAKNTKGKETESMVILS
ncbi:unnamed protein product [Lactuca virosa]|uniref:Uncharacterized protein n=1 Tax=Lactuca virosa TaxID=75947 RepID=A0AAU9P830_9ASTR|nr:unnamed protein product [Lactuca virosa]